MRFKTEAEEQSEHDTRERWANDPALRAEFCDNISIAIAYFRAEARGATKEFRGRVETVKSAGTE